MQTRTRQITAKLLLPLLFFGLLFGNNFGIGIADAPSTALAKTLKYTGGTVDLNTLSEDDTVRLTVGATGNFFYNGTAGLTIPSDAANTNWTYQYSVSSSASRAPLEVSEDGTYSAVAFGEAELSVYVRADYEVTETDYDEEFGYETDTYSDYESAYINFSVTVTPDMSKVKLNKTAGTSYKSSQSYSNAATYVLQIKGPYKFSNSDIGVTCSSKKLYPTYSIKNNKITLSTYGTGKATVKVKIYGKTYKFKWTVKEIKTKKTNALIAVGGSYQIPTKNLSAKKFIWTSKNPSVATVSKSGKVSAKNAGSVLIVGKYQKQKVGIVINVTTPAKINAINTAKNIAATSTYSQPLRMNAGYYDCSSLVWRAYVNNGCNFGQASYAPTAAGEGQWIDANGKRVNNFWKTGNNLPMQAGDVIFITGENNGRYLGIYHVEMFTGYDFGGFYGSKPSLYTLWANRPQYLDPSFVVGRP